MKHKVPRIYCAQCGLHVDAIRVRENVCTMQIEILVECHGLVEVMTMDKFQFVEVVRGDVAGKAFENKLEDHSNGKATHQAEITGPSVPGKAVALRGV